MALAIADPLALKSLLVNCLPPLANPACLGSITSEVGIPLRDRGMADGVVQYEVMRCVLVATRGGSGASSRTGSRVPYGQRGDRDEGDRLTQHESELQTLVQNLPLAPTIAVLSNAGFQPEQIQDILRLPHYAWHKSWWHTIATDGSVAELFLRCLRTFHYPDGSITLQYKDFFAAIKPECFTSVTHKVLIVLRSPQQGFAETLQQVNRQREALGLVEAILVCDRASDLEIQAFTRQGIHLYPIARLIRPIQSSCAQCGQQACPLHHQSDSPVVMCRNFLLEGELI